MPELSPLLTEFFDFWPRMWAAFLARTEFEKATDAVALAATFGPLLWAFMKVISGRERRRALRERANLEERIAILEEARKGLENRLKSRESQIKEMSFSVPADARRRADLLRADGNEELAIAALRDCFETLRPDLVSLCSELALHHVSIAPDFGEHQLVEAKRMADLAFMLDPGDARVGDIQTELSEIDARTELTATAYDPLDPKWDDARLFMHLGSSKDAEAAFAALLEKGEEAREAGSYLRAERILARAYRIGCRVYGKYDEQTLRAAWPWLRTLATLDLFAPALQLASDLSANLEAGTEVKAAADFYRAQALQAAGRVQEALGIVEQTVRDWTELRGQEDRETLVNTRLWVRLLADSGQVPRALPESEQHVHVCERALGAEAHETLQARFLYAALLHDTGESKKALAELNAVIGVENRVRGPRHPATLSSRSSRAEILAQIGDVDSAREELVEILPMIANVLGRSHSQHQDAAALLDKLAPAGKDSTESLAAN